MPKIERLIIPQPITPLTENDRPQLPTEANFIRLPFEQLAMLMIIAKYPVPLAARLRSGDIVMETVIKKPRLGYDIYNNYNIYPDKGSNRFKVGRFRGGSGRSRRERANCKACMNQHTGEHTCGSLSFNQSLGPKI